VLSTFTERISFTSTTEDCVLNGSHHVKDFKLDERFLIDVTMTFRWKNPPSMGASSNGNGNGAVGQPKPGMIEADGRIVIEVSGFIIWTSGYGPLDAELLLAIWLTVSNTPPWTVHDTTAPRSIYRLHSLTYRGRYWMPRLMQLYQRLCP